MENQKNALTKTDNNLSAASSDNTSATFLQNQSNHQINQDPLEGDDEEQPVKPQRQFLRDIDDSSDEESDSVNEVGGTYNIAVHLWKLWSDFEKDGYPEQLILDAKKKKENKTNQSQKNQNKAPENEEKSTPANTPIRKSKNSKLKGKSSPQTQTSKSPIQEKLSESSSLSWSDLSQSNGTEEEIQQNNTPNNSNSDEIFDERKIFVSFLMHALGIRLIYSAPVTREYYAYKSSHLAVNEQIKENLVQQWLMSSIKEALTCITSASYEDSEIDKIVGELLKNKDRLIHLQSKNSLEFIHEETLKKIKEIMDKPDIIMSPGKGDINNNFKKKYSAGKKSVRKSAPEYNPTNFENAVIKLPFNCKKTLDKVISEKLDVLAEAYCQDLTKNRSSSNDSLTYIKDSIIKLVDSKKNLESLYQDKLHQFIFLHKLKINLHLLKLKRCTLPKLHIFDSQTGAQLLTGLRITMRSQTRYAKNALQEHHEILKKVSSGEVIFDLSTRLWRIGDVIVYDAQKTQAQTYGKILGRDHEIQDIGSYTNLADKLKIPTDESKILGKLIRKFINPDSSELSIDDLHKNINATKKDNIACLTMLLFYVEVMRNPAISIINNMLLDLLIEGHINFEKVIELTPMKLERSNQLSRCLNKLYQKYMPHKYFYPGNDIPEKNYEKDMIIAEYKVVKIWLEKIVLVDDTEKLSLENLLEICLSKILLKIKTWYGFELNWQHTLDKQSSPLIDSMPSFSNQKQRDGQDIKSPSKIDNVTDDDPDTEEPTQHEPDEKNSQKKPIIRNILMEIIKSDDKDLDKASDTANDPNYENVNDEALDNIAALSEDEENELSQNLKRRMNI